MEGSTFVHHGIDRSVRMERRRHPVDETTIMKVMDELGASSLDASLGGSAWNTIFALGQMNVGVRLGYIGVVGRVETPGVSFLRQMDLLGIDRQWVHHDLSRPCGLCLSYIDDNDRVLLTHPGANYGMHDYIEANLSRLARYLAAARYVHVTSFLDDRTPRQLLRLLIKAKELNPLLQISFDPGHSHPAARLLRARQAPGRSPVVNTVPQGQHPHMPSIADVRGAPAVRVGVPNRSRTALACSTMLRWPRPSTRVNQR